MGYAQVSKAWSSDHGDNAKATYRSKVVFCLKKQEDIVTKAIHKISILKITQSSLLKNDCLCKGKFLKVVKGYQNVLINVFPYL